MKRAIRYLSLLTIILGVLIQAYAQTASYKTNNGIALVFGIGGSYQQSDIANSSGAGFDFCLGSNLYQKENAFLHSIIMILSSCSLP